MGRWAQRRIRGTAPGQVVAPVSIVRLVGQTATEAEIEFSAPVSCTDGPTSDSGLQLDGQDVTNVHQTDATHVTVESTDASTGNPWTLNAQPGWCATTLDIPESGLIE